MRGLFGALCAATLAALSFGPTPARAMIMPASAGLAGAAAQIDPVETVACRRVWRCGPYGCGWRTACSGPRHYAPYSAYRPYRYGYRPYHYGYSRPYYRPYRPAYGPYYRPYRPYYGYRTPYRPRPYWGGRMIYGPHGYGVYDPRNVWW